MSAIMIAAYGASATDNPSVSTPSVSLGDYTITDVRTSPSDAEVRFRLETDGRAEEVVGIGGSQVLLENIMDAGSPSGVYVQVSVSGSGGSFSGSTGNLGLLNAADREWVLTNSDNFGVTHSRTLTFTFREGTSTGTVLDTATITLNAEVTDGS